MPYADMPHDGLAKGGTVAYLLAHAQELAAAGVFNGHTSAYVIFTYLCTHPAEPIRPGWERKTWNNYQPEVDWPHWDVRQIEADTPLHRPR